MPWTCTLRIEVLAHHRERVLELHEPAQRQVLALHRHDHAVGRDERVDRQQAERGRRVDEDVVVAVAHLDERLLERALAADQRGERELGAGEVDRRDGDVDLDGLDDVRDRDAMDEHVEHRALDRVRVHPLAHREVALRIEVDHEDAMPQLAERDAEVQRRRRLRDAALLVREHDDVRHQRALCARDAASAAARGRRGGAGLVASTPAGSSGSGGGSATGSGRGWSRGRRRRAMTRPFWRRDSFTRLRRSAPRPRSGRLQGLARPDRSRIRSCASSVLAVPVVELLAETRDEAEPDEVDLARSAGSSRPRGDRGFRT